MQGVYDLAMSLMVDIQFAKCMCVDAAKSGSNFELYVMDNCYYFTPTHLKPLVLGLIENARTGSAASVRELCIAMVEYAKSSMTNSMPCSHGLTHSSRARRPWLQAWTICFRLCLVRLAGKGLFLCFKLFY